MVCKNVVCVYWGDKYSVEYVYKLYGSVKRNLTGPFNFYCLTDKPEQFNDTDIKVRLLPEGKEGWWTKLDLFQSPLYDIEGTVVYLDIDIVIVDSIDFLFDYRKEESFLGTTDFIFPESHWNSSVFRFEVGGFTQILEEFNKLKKNDDSTYSDSQRKYLGDQDLITKVLRPNGEHIKYSYPENKIISYKRKGRARRLPPCNIVIFHGEPNPHEVKDNWVVSNWK